MKFSKWRALWQIPSFGFLGRSDLEPALRIHMYYDYEVHANACIVRLSRAHTAAAAAALGINAFFDKMNSNFVETTNATGEPRRHIVEIYASAEKNAVGLVYPWPLTSDLERLFSSSHSRAYLLQVALKPAIKYGDRVTRRCWRITVRTDGRTDERTTRKHKPLAAYCWWRRLKAPKMQYNSYRLTSFGETLLDTKKLWRPSRAFFCKCSLQAVQSVMPVRPTYQWVRNVLRAVIFYTYYLHPLQVNNCVVAVVILNVCNALTPVHLNRLIKKWNGTLYRSYTYRPNTLRGNGLSCKRSSISQRNILGLIPFFLIGSGRGYGYGQG